MTSREVASTAIGSAPAWRVRRRCSRKRVGEIHVVAGEGAPDPGQLVVQRRALHHRRERLQLLGARALAAARRAQQPEARIEHVDVGLEHGQIAVFEGVLDHRHQAPEAVRGLVQPLEALGVLGDRLADPADAVGEIAELLEDRVVRDRAQLRSGARD